MKIGNINQLINNKDKVLFLRRKILKKQGYKLVGNHSAIKLCHWCKSSLLNKGTCYKHKFYGINSWQCIQATITLDICNLRCGFCWRDIDYNPKKVKFSDSPKEIVQGFIQQQKQALSSHYKIKANKERLEQALKPKHVALSLTGDACIYPKLPELIKEIHKNNMTSSPH